MTKPTAAARKDQIVTASLEIAHLAALARWVGFGLTQASDAEMKKSTVMEAGTMFSFLGDEIERRCAVIDEAL